MGLFPLQYFFLKNNIRKPCVGFTSLPPLNFILFRKYPNMFLAMPRKFPSNFRTNFPLGRHHEASQIKDVEFPLQFVSGNGGILREEYLEAGAGPNTSGQLGSSGSGWGHGFGSNFSTVLWLNGTYERVMGGPERTVPILNGPLFAKADLSINRLGMSARSTFRVAKSLKSAE